MPCDYSRYPENWKTEIRPAILDRANHQCEFCKVDNYNQGFRFLDGKFISLKDVIDALEDDGKDYFDDELKHCVKKDQSVNPIKIVLTIAHLDHDVKNNDHENLRALCQRCHNIHDKEFRKANRQKNKGVVKLDL